MRGAAARPEQSGLIDATDSWALKLAL